MENDEKKFKKIQGFLRFIMHLLSMTYTTGGHGRPVPKSLTDKGLYHEDILWRRRGKPVFWVNDLLV